MTDQTMLQFPCDFPLKIIGTASDTFVNDIQNIIHKHFPDAACLTFSYKPSGNGSYTSISATVHAETQPALDALYRELTVYPGIKMVL